MTGPFVVTGVDTINANVDSVPTDPASVQYVMGYVSGTTQNPDIQWTPTSWARFPRQKHVRIYQGYGAVLNVKSFDVIDVEEYTDSIGQTRWTVTPEFAAELVKERVAAGVEWTTIYANDSALLAVVNAVKALGGNELFDGHLNVGYADWNLNEAEAAKLLGTQIHGVSCVYVQWASPESNPNTLLPGTDKTLSETNCDLNVVDAYWEPSGGFAPPAPSPVPVPTPTPVPRPVPVPVPPVSVLGVLVTGQPPAYVTREVHSTDGGKTWL